MKDLRSVQAGFPPRCLCASAAFVAGSFALAALVSLTTGALAQNPAPARPTPDKGTEIDGFMVHQSFDLGGHVADTFGSTAMYATLVNLHSGPRFLGHTLEMRPKEGSKHTLFDLLTASSTGYGGDPNDVTRLRASKGKLYDLRGQFRRDRQYFDYDLFANPLVPSGITSNGYTFPQVQSAPHLFNTVRRMTDVDLTLYPLARFTARAGYAQNVQEGPSQSSVHMGVNALLLQNWRNSTDSWTGSLEWKPFVRTSVTYEQHVTHYKGDTNWQLPASLLPLQLPDGTPVTLGFDVVANPSSSGSGCSVDPSKPAILDSTTSPATANPCVSDFTGYSRVAPIRSLFPTEELRFQSAHFESVRLNGQLLYSASKMSMPVYTESFTGLVSRTTKAAPTGATSWCTTSSGTHMDCEAAASFSGSASARRITTDADFGVLWEISKRWSLSEHYSFLNFRQPATGTLSETDSFAPYAGATIAVTGTASSSTTPNFLGQRRHINSTTASWQAASYAQLSLGYRYSHRVITEGLLADDGYADTEQEHTALFATVLRPAKDWRVNFSVERSMADSAYVQTTPRQSEHYQLRTTYRANPITTLTLAYNDFERRNNTTLIDLKAHNRSLALGINVTPDERWGIDLSYGYINAFSRVTNCFVDTVAAAPSDATAMPIGTACGNAVNSSTSTVAFYGTSYYDSPTNYGSASLFVTPVRSVHAVVGYRANGIDGKTELLSPRAVNGSLSSIYQSPYANLSWKFASAWTVKGDYNYYGYGEGSAVGPTAPRSFHGNIYTFGMHYEY